MSRSSVLHVIESEGPGGAETVMVELVSRVDAESFGSAAAVPSSGTWLRTALEGMTVHLVGPTRGMGGLPFDFAYVSKLRRLIVDERPTIVHAHSFDSAVYASLALIGLKSRLIVTFHGQVDVVAQRRFSSVKWRLLRRASAIVCVSESLAVMARGLRPALADRVFTIHNGVDVERLRPLKHGRLRARLSTPAGTLLIGALGNVRPAKSYETLLKAVRDAKDRGLDVHAVIAGDDSGPPGESIRALRDSLDLAGSVSFIGFVTDVDEFLNGVDIFVLSSTHEGFSLATVQAMACGVPVVATRCGGPEEIIEERVSGIMVDSGDWEALAAAIDGLSKSPQSYLDGMATAARRRAMKCFSIDSMVTNYERLYSSILTQC